MSADRERRALLGEAFQKQDSKYTVLLMQDPAGRPPRRLLGAGQEVGGGRASWDLGAHSG